MISILIIGKNEASNLPKLYHSLSKITIEKEIIYVDSASEDQSVLISSQYCDQVIAIAQSDQLCAAAGRYVGSKKASGEWILYLDGDMELEDDFALFLNQKNYLNFDKNICGFIGYYTYLYSDGSQNFNTLLQPKNSVVSHFGGAVLLQKDAVLSAKNWNPSVVANEEIDLHVRLQSLRLKVYGVDHKMVKHIAKKTSNFHTLLSLLYPLNKRYFGFGQVLKSQYLHGTLLSFIQFHPYPFIFWSLLIISLFQNILFFGFFIYCIYISYIKRPHYLIIYFTDFFRGLLGFFSYQTYKPTIKTLKLEQSNNVL